MLTNINDVERAATQKYIKSEARKTRGQIPLFFNLIGTLFARYLVPSYSAIDKRGCAEPNRGKDFTEPSP